MSEWWNLTPIDQQPLHIAEAIRLIDEFSSSSTQHGRAVKLVGFAAAKGWMPETKSAPLPGGYYGIFGPCGGFQYGAMEYGVMLLGKSADSREKFRELAGKAGGWLARFALRENRPFMGCDSPLADWVEHLFVRLWDTGYVVLCSDGTHQIVNPFSASIHLMRVALTAPTDKRSEGHVETPIVAKLVNDSVEVVTPETLVLNDTASAAASALLQQAKAVYISYAWGNEGEGIVDRVYDSLKADGYDIRRDKQHLPYTGSITEFMKEMGHGACIIVVVSDKSLRSPHCMFELLEINRNQQFRERICPIVISDAKIHSLADRLEYVAYWKAEYQRLEKLVKKVGINVLSADGSFREYEKFRDISQNADKLLTMLGDMYTSTPARIEANDFELLKKSVTERIEQSFAKSLN